MSSLVLTIQLLGYLILTHTHLFARHHGSKIQESYHGIRHTSGLFGQTCPKSPRDSQRFRSQDAPNLCRSISRASVPPSKVQDTPANGGSTNPLHWDLDQWRAPTGPPPRRAGRIQGDQSCDLANGGGSWPKFHPWIFLVVGYPCHISS